MARKDAQNIGNSILPTVHYVAYLADRKIRNHACVGPLYLPQLTPKINNARYTQSPHQSYNSAEIKLHRLVKLDNVHHISTREGEGVGGGGADGAPTFGK